MMNIPCTSDNIYIYDSHSRWRPNYLLDSDTSLSDIHGVIPSDRRQKRGGVNGESSSSDSSTNSDSTDSSALEAPSPVEDRYWGSIPADLRVPRPMKTSPGTVCMVDTGRAPTERYERRVSKHEMVTRCMNKVKLKHRSALKLCDWQRYDFESDFDDYVKEMVAHCEKLDDEHQQRTRMDTPPKSPIIVDGIDRVHCSDYSIERFRQEYERPAKPVVIRGCSDGWSAHKNWTYENLMRTSYRNVILKCGEDDDGHSCKVRLKTFLRYMRYQSTEQRADDSPLYVFDDDYGDREIGKVLLDDYDVPKYFKDDVFRFVDASRRPPYRWFLIGPKRSGTGVHTDPLATSAWNTVVSGMKLWILFKPGARRSAVKGKYLRERGEDGEAITYFRRVLPRIRHLEHERGDGGLGMVEFIQYPGDTVFVPAGWWHGVLNLSDSFAVTQNFASPVNFHNVWLRARQSRKHMARRWLNTLRVKYPEMAEVATSANERDDFKFNIKPRQSQHSKSTTSPDDASGDNSSSSSARGESGAGTKRVRTAS